MKRFAFIPLCLLFLSCGSDTIVVGSKNFTESVLLGEIVAQQLESAGCDVERKLNLGGTLVCDSAISGGSLDVYVEYSGTALTAILGRGSSSDRSEVLEIVREAYDERELVWGPTLGFNNTFAMLVRRDDSQQLGLVNISDLEKVADTFQPAFGYEFTERPDGWQGLQEAYGFSFARPARVMDLGLTYKALASGEVDLIAGNSTDGLIASLELVHLRDDRDYFPPYDAAIVSRRDIAEKCSAAPSALGRLGDELDDETMRRLNFAVDGEKRSVRTVAAEFLGSLD